MSSIFRSLWPSPEGDLDSEVQLYIKINSLISCNFPPDFMVANGDLLFQRIETSRDAVARGADGE